MFLTESDKKLANEAIKIADKINGIFICVSGSDKKQIIVTVSDAYVNLYPANETLSKILDRVDGKGGGNKKLATGGSKVSENEIKDSVLSISFEN